VLTFIFVAFLLAGRSSKVIRSGIYAEIDSKIRRYLGTKLVISAITGLLVWIILTLFGLHMAPLFGILAFLLNFIPSIGSIIATMLPVPIALAQFDSPLVIVGVIALPGAVQMTIGNVIEPKLMGEGLELHPATILLALAFWGLLWGPIGMLLAVPITASGRIVLMRFETTRPFGELLAGRLPDDSQSPEKNAATSATG
jgi:AI-2 transport protein TqsA